MNVSFEEFVIEAIATACPSGVARNQDIPGLSEDEARRLVQNIGVASRHDARVYGDSIEDAFLHCARRVLERERAGDGGLDLVATLTQSSVLVAPGIASKMHARLQLPTSCIAFDLNFGCSAYVLGLHAVMSYLRANALDRALLLVGDFNSEFDMDERRVRPLFGDAVSATLVVRSPAPSSRFSFCLRTRGAGWDAITISRDARPTLAMDGMNVMSFALAEVPAIIRDNLERNALTMEDLDDVVLHQANRLINAALEKKLGLANAPRALASFGNTSGASIPLVLTTALAPDYFVAPRKVMLCGFGIGLSWGSCLMTTTENIRRTHDVHSEAER